MEADVEDKIITVIDKACQVDDYDSAVKLANLLLASARNSNDPARSRPPRRRSAN